jgi:hypothetical protein
MANAKRERYAELVNAYLRAQLVTTDFGAYPVFNTRYEGDPKAGAVKIPVRSEIALSDYNPVTGAAPAAGDASFVTLAINKDKAVNEIIDGYDAAAVPADLAADRLESAGYKLAQTLDVDGVAALVSAASAKSYYIEDGIFAAIVDAATALTAANVPLEGRWLIVKPAVYGELLKSGDFIRQGDLSQELVESGYIGQAAGFAVKTSNFVTGADFIAGHPNWAVRVKEWALEPEIVSLNASGNYIGASAVHGRIVYGHGVTNAAAVLKFTGIPKPEPEA